MLRLLVVLTICAIGANAACTLYYSIKYPGIYTRKFGSNNIMVIPEAGKLTIDEGVNLNAYCSSGFQYYSYSETTPLPQMTLTCSGGTVRYMKPGSSATYSLQNTGSLSCSGVSTYYEANLTDCNTYGLEYGFIIEKNPVIFADVCFDLNTMKTKYVHYVASTRTTIVENQKEFNPSNSTLVSGKAIDVLFDSTTIQKENTSIIASVNSEMPNYATIVSYQLDKLIPLDIAAGPLTEFATSFDSTNMVPWWKNLKEGNWIEVENAIASISLDNTYDVFAGTSGFVSFPYNGKCFFNERLTYKIDQYVRSVPLYIWNYVKERHSKSDGIVIVGVNSPFLEVSNKTQQLCDDMCDNVPWLNVVNKVRHMASLGYVFCCRPKDVQFKLDGFPEL